ncbi:hypothetical protein KP509_34G057400 [Ceratopteris richardii]|uniref:GDP-mannose 4,6-dehydratase n=1 Tax=Ceratopteris richardii TaxID=49495 RepID=A0A8T2QKB7_CERRI|nr:hypothetical protein KP509_34G057400 [Ceratopteris richardii]KAH7284508.1 hypothetical protein KP509_34G057400 [Ceratopteris richardii]KAH7284509.1 hypothetical protein KP509_34G057400 [Ceratopteris richardii]
MKSAQSHVGVSFENPEYTADVVATGALRLLQAVQSHVETTKRKIRFYQAGSSEMYGANPPPQDENTIFHPRSPYGVAKVAAYWYSVHYRETYGLFACNGILFNHESPRRAENFVTRKITRAVGRIKMGLQPHVTGDLQAIMWRQCGLCYSKMNLMTMWLHQRNLILWRSYWR